MALTADDMARIRDMVENAMSKSIPGQFDAIRNAIMAILSSSEFSDRFIKSAEKNAVANERLLEKIQSFQERSIKNQEDVAGFMAQVLESVTDLQNREPCAFAAFGPEVQNILVGEDYKLKEQIKLFNEAGIARKLRNFVVTIYTLIALAGIITISSIVYAAIVRSELIDLQESKNFQSTVKQKIIEHSSEEMAP